MSAPLLLATDGSCLRNPGGPTGWAWVAADGTWGGGSRTSGTNNIGELLAIRDALAAHPGRALHIQADSQYAIRCITEWGPSWRAKGITGKKNTEIIFAIIDAIASHGAPVAFEWVRGHDATNKWPLNTAADRLAGELAARRADTTASGTTTIDTTRLAGGAR